VKPTACPKQVFLESVERTRPAPKNQSVAQCARGRFLEEACPNAPDVCQKTRSGGTSKPQILRGELKGIGACRIGFQIRGIASIHGDPEFVRDMGVPDKRDPNCRGQLDMHTRNIFTHFSFEQTESGLHPDYSSSQVANILLTNK
jgi:hypothetical protein